MLGGCALGLSVAVAEPAVLVWCARGVSSQAGDYNDTTTVAEAVTSPVFGVEAVKVNCRLLACFTVPAPFP
jgi:hypothetical protein